MSVQFESHVRPEYITELSKNTYAQEQAKLRVKDAEEAVRKAKNAVPQDSKVIAEAQQSLDNAKQELSGLKAERKEYKNTVVKPYAKDAAVSNVISAGHGLQNELKNEIKNTSLSDSFYRDVGAAFTGKRTGNAADALEESAKEQAQLARERGATRDAEAQQAQGIANRDVYGEAGKIASAQNDAENRQQINNTSFAQGTSAARLRKTNAPDVRSQIERSDIQRAKAAELREKGDDARSKASELEGVAKSANVMSRDMDRMSNMQRNLSLGTGTIDEISASPESASPESASPESASPAPENKPSSTNSIGGAVNIQNIINALAGSKVRWYNSGNGFKRGYVGDGGWTNNMEQQLQQSAKGQNIDQLSSQRAEKVKVWQKANGFPETGNLEEGQLQGFGETVGHTTSDVRLKDIEAICSDFNMSLIKDALDLDCLTYEQFEYLLKKIGRKHTFNDREYDLDNQGDWLDETTRDSVLKDYADNIRNYVYNYKPIAQRVSSDNDPSVEHIGPMAQDIEKVNPACVKTDAQGYESVDTGRLALMNAGAIGDVARQLEELDRRLSQLGV